jgi:hypothetical protein
MVDFSINGIKISILLTKFSLLIPLNLGGISIMRIVLPLKSSIGPEIRSASSAIKRMNSDFSKIEILLGEVVEP